MNDNNLIPFIQSVLENMPQDWLNLTTHRLDIYDETKAKIQFLDELELIYRQQNAENNNLSALLESLPTAYDYIRLGHPLSCVLEWTIARINERKADEIISFASQTAPILAILRKNALAQKATQILYSGSLPENFDTETIKSIYGYSFELKKVEQGEPIDLTKALNTSIVYVANDTEIHQFIHHLPAEIDFYINLNSSLGSILLINGIQNEHYISDIQHVRRRETIAMTPANCLKVLNDLAGNRTINHEIDLVKLATNRDSVISNLATITNTTGKALVASSGLSMQYAIMMGLIDEAKTQFPEKAVRFVVPPNCYGGTNDQARRVAACLPNVTIVDLPVDGGNDMVKSIDKVLNQIALEDAIPYIIAEIPTNPRVEVPDLEQLKKTLEKPRQTALGQVAIAPVFILDQTFCPNVHFLGQGNILSTVKAIAYASGSKFPSGGKCTAGYAVANAKAASLMDKIAVHLSICDNEATALQYEILAEQLPSMTQRIKDAYLNTRDFVNFIQTHLPLAKINFVSEELANQGFTPSVFSLDLPTKGNSDEEREAYKRAQNLKLINAMITNIPLESKYCVSYGQLKGCYWTIPATSTQGTTKEGDKDYIIRAALSGNMDLDLHKKVFLEFVKEA